MEFNEEKQGGNEGETRRGRPKKDIDPSGTESLFLGDNTVNPILVDTYDESEDMGGENEPDRAGTVGGAGGFSLADRMAMCAELAARGKSEQVRLNAVIKYSELEKQLAAETGGGDIGEELCAFLELIKGQTPGELAGSV